MIETATITFVPSLEVVGRIPGIRSSAAIFQEPMLWGASWDFSRERGGPLTCEVLDVLERERPLMREIEAHGRHVCIDTTSKHLLVGQYPSIPGWHCDALPQEPGRPHRYDVGRLHDEMLVYLVTVADAPNGISNTLVADRPATIECDLDRLWESVDEAADRTILSRTLLRDGEVLRIGPTTLHRATAAHATGWRYLFRLTMYHKEPKNVIRNHTEIYVPVVAR